MSTSDLDKQLLKMKALGITISSTTANPDSLVGMIQAAADRLGMGENDEVTDVER